MNEEAYLSLVNYRQTKASYMRAATGRGVSRVAQRVPMWMQRRDEEARERCRAERACRAGAVNPA